ncbi:hypothetical protein BcepSauron_418 [Burkholderia phage BcepSauron]|uniref:Uncharacterized protein n=2 Tax=Sarumanvirus TaxID=2843450 RepID=A0A482MMB5_9CAUD|nr:hypothetical protein H1O16_gp416 [Burkholderia phage BcepSaruman]YP_009904796.1 hypothetical protein H1O17_gp418 [Burkholderia phage BcepSauron]QBQ74798.1 hypothetical protein BcepSauron_418 [Burkholderia phage BcepSauron]QBX06829.1 hypothetical protein BcepSaruman_416 [Burkholderia phage BcepSaruman]
MFKLVAGIVMLVGAVDAVAFERFDKGAYFMAMAACFLLVDISFDKSMDKLFGRTNGG